MEINSCTQRRNLFLEFSSRLHALSVNGNKALIRISFVENCRRVFNLDKWNEFDIRTLKQQNASIVEP